MCLSYVCICARIRRSEVDTECLLQAHSTLFIYALVFYLLLVPWDRASLSRPGWPHSHRAVLASASQVLRWKACATMPGCQFTFEIGLTELRACLFSLAKKLWGFSYLCPPQGLGCTYTPPCSAIFRGSWEHEPDGYTCTADTSDWAPCKEVGAIHCLSQMAPQRHNFPNPPFYTHRELRPGEANRIRQRGSRRQVSRTNYFIPVSRFG